MSNSDQKLNTDASIFVTGCQAAVRHIVFKIRFLDIEIWKIAHDEVGCLYLKKKNLLDIQGMA